MSIDFPGVVEPANSEAKFSVGSFGSTWAKRIAWSMSQVEFGLLHHCS